VEKENPSDTNHIKLTVGKRPRHGKKNLLNDGVRTRNAEQKRNVARGLHNADINRALNQQKERDLNGN